MSGLNMAAEIDELVSIYPPKEREGREGAG